MDENVMRVLLLLSSSRATSSCGAGAMDRPSYLEEDYSSLDGLDDDVFHSDDFGLAGQPGSAGYRLHVPPAGFVLDPHLQEEPQEGQREARAEVQIARKLQCIADQFHRLHIQRDHLQPFSKVND
ncbi:hypothetical protein DV515_00002208 [Chloebia gouldiae]|uniref:Uncharacterized protein n=1 Tax=Chloebia gouldiae TaxID=44316 RepID=A0A3L8SWM2_CHLGU|nr:hypothetical protein DV515_00002208 [Chloebia gouldiae]